jgi:carboxymethylenebutenolidase
MIEETLDIATAAGAMPTFICRPERGVPHPAVFLLMDAPGVRDELRDMARRLAAVGYAVLLPNLYYRAGRDTTFGPQVLEKNSAEWARMRAIRTKMTIPPVMDDFAAMLRFVDASGWADRGPVGCHGYCMSGPYALAAAARYPDRVAAAARSTAPGWSATPSKARISRWPRRAASLYIGCAEHDELAPAPMVRSTAGLFTAAAAPANSKSIPACIMASRSRNAGATTNPRPNATGNACSPCIGAA